MRQTEAVLVEREKTNQELVRCITHPAVLFVAGLMAINWYVDRPGGPGRIEGVPMWGLLGTVCTASAIAPALPDIAKAGGEMVSALAPLLAAAAVMPK